MLVLPPIHENSSLKTPNLLRRHSIDAQFFKSPSVLERQFTVIQNSKPNQTTNNTSSTTTNVNFKPVLKTKYRDYSNSNNKSRLDDEAAKLKVKFIIDENNYKLPPIDQKNIVLDEASKLSREIKARSTQIPVKHNASLVTTQAARTTKPMEDKKMKTAQFTSKEYIAKNNYLSKSEQSRRSSSHTDKFHYGTKKRVKKEAKREPDNEDEDEYEYIEETQQSKEVKEFISLVKRLQISENQTPLPEIYRQIPKQPRLLTNLSSEGQYALMKTYEDTIANEISTMHPNLAIYVPRVLTSKFRKRVVLPKNNRFLNFANFDSRDTLVTATPLAKQNSFMQQPLPTKNDPNFMEHQLIVSQQLEIAQEILDIIKKNKGEYVTTPNLDQNLDVLRSYAAYVKIWTKYFHLR
jgi:hypothetical protein